MTYENKNHDNNNACLYYDGQCPICQREMTHLNKLKSDQLDLIDIHQARLPDDKTPDELLSRLHYKTADGTWLTGLDANVAAWSHTRWGFIWRMLRWPLIAPMADRVYEYWIKKRQHD